MPRETAESIIKLIAVVTMLVGTILTSQTVIALVAASNAMSKLDAMQVDITGPAVTMGLAGFLAQTSTVLWGYLLFVISPVVADKVTQ